MKIRFLMIMLITVLLTVTASGVITIPAESERDTVIEATIKTDMPNGADFFGGWATPLVDSIPVNANKIHIAGKPGSYIVYCSGYWIHLGQEITVKDINGDPQTFRPLLGHGKVDELKPYKITGTPDPDPDPDPDPTPDPEPEPGPKQIVFFIVADDLDKPSKISPGQRELVTSLKVRQVLLDQGHELIQVIDDDQIKEGVPSKWKPWIKAAMNKPLPLMAWANNDGGPIQTSPLPHNLEDVIEIIGAGT